MMPICRYGLALVEVQPRRIWRQPVAIEARPGTPAGTPGLRSAN